MLGAVAHLGERLHGMEKVASSSLVSSTIFNKLGDTYNRIAFFLTFIAVFTHLNMLTILNYGQISFIVISLTNLTDRVMKISP